VLRVAEDMPPVVVDVGRLELALVNLLSNAIKYSDPSKAERFVAITARAVAGGGHEICVRDNGIGIPSNRISQIFRRFTRAHADRSEHEAVTGVGLGLAIVDDCVIAMNGTITVESTEGDGTTFCLTLPATPATATPSDLLKADESASANSPPD
jgi:signal transduction histidine kinase